MNGAPRELFKYLPPTRVSVMKDLLIRFTQPSSLNDTRELRPPIKGIAAPEKLERIAREGLAPALRSEALDAKKKILSRFCPGLPELVDEIFLQTYTQKATQQIERRHQQSPEGEPEPSRLSQIPVRHQADS